MKILSDFYKNKTEFTACLLLNTPNREIEYDIVPDTVLHKRFQNQNRMPEGARKAELTLWLMNKTVYDTTNLSMEGEYYSLSSGTCVCFKTESLSVLIRILQ